MDTLTLGWRGGEIHARERKPVNRGLKSRRPEVAGGSQREHIRVVGMSQILAEIEERRTMPELGAGNVIGLAILTIDVATKRPEGMPGSSITAFNVRKHGTELVSESTRRPITDGWRVIRVT